VLNKFLKTLYNKVFVNIVVQGTKSMVYVEICSSNVKPELITNAYAEFETASLNSKMLEFINSYTKETPYFYISVLDSSLEQGVIPTCEKNRLSYFADVSASEYKCTQHDWTYFTSKTDLYATEKKYHKIGVDFIFSPFSILVHFFKDKISSTLSMYILIEASSLSIAVFNNDKLLFGNHSNLYDISETDGLSSGDLEYDFDLELDDGIDLEDVALESSDIDFIDDFGDIEDLDAIEDIDEFSVHRDLEEELYQATKKASDYATEENIQSDSTKDYLRFTLIKDSISTYYKDEKYESEFIENVYIADSVGVSSELKKYLEEEMFLNVYVRQVDIAVEVCKLSKMEFSQ